MTRPSPSSAYKRDQVERAIAVASRISTHPDDDRFPRLKVDLKRLLELDRKQGKAVPPTVSPRFAFHGASPPGRGTDVTYSSYDAFALLIGRRLLHAGFPQKRVITFMREIRPSLEATHGRILRTAPRSYDDDRTSEADLENHLRNGALVSDPEQMVFLLALAGEEAEVFPDPHSSDPDKAGNICLNKAELRDRLRWVSHEGHGAVVLELVNAAHQLRFHLDRTEVRTRGRS